MSLSPPAKDPKTLYRELAISLGGLIFVGILAIRWREAPILSEYLVACAVLYPIFRLKEVRGFLAGLPKGYRAALAVFLFLMTMGQLMRNQRLTFPFIAWTMFGLANSQSNDAVVWSAVEGVTATGEVVPINPSDLFPSLDLGTLRMPSMSGLIFDRLPKTHDKAIALLRSLDTVYERKEGQRLAEIRVVRHARILSSGKETSEVVLTERLP